MDNKLSQEEAEIMKQVEHVRKFMDVFDNYDEDDVSPSVAAQLDLLKFQMRKFGDSGCEARDNKQSKNKNRKENKPNKSKNKSSRKQKKLESDTDSNTSDTDSSEQEEDTETETTEGDEEDEGEGESDMKTLTRALEKLDFRRSPEMEQYDEEGEETLDEYLKRFERYCRLNVRAGNKGDESFWLAELKTKFTGETHKILTTVTGKNDTYSKVKKKLLEYAKNTSKLRQKKRKSEFRAMTYDKEESIYMYSLRLEKAFRMAHSDKIETSKKLVKRFTKSTPRSFSKLIEPIIFNDKSKKKSTSWSTLKEYARVYDMDKIEEKQQQEEVAQKHTINITSNETTGSSMTRRSPAEPTARTETRNPGAQANSNQNNQNKSHRNTGHYQSNREWRGSDQRPNRNRGQNYQDRSNEGASSQQQNYAHRERGRGNRPPLRMPLPGRIVVCNMCGKVGHIDRECEIDKRCYGCGKKGHTRRRCKTDGWNAPASNTSGTARSNNDQGASGYNNTTATQQLNG